MGVYDIQGKNCIFQLKIGDEYLPVVCAKSFTFNPVTDMKETTTVGSGFWKEFRPRKLSYTISFSGLLQIESLITQEKVKTLFDYQVQFLPFVYRLLYYDNSNNVMNINGTVYVSSNLFDVSAVNLVNTTTELQGTGAIEIIDYVPDSINVTVQVTGNADAKCRFVLFDANGNIKYDTSTLEALLPTSGWLVQGESVTFAVQKGQYAWGIATDDIFADLNTFDLNITPAVSINIPYGDYSQNSLSTVYDFLTNKTALFTIGLPVPPPTCVPVLFNGTPVLPDGQQSVPYSYLIPITGTAPFTLSNITKPSWMSISVIDLIDLNGFDHFFVSITGTPDVTGTGIVVAFNLTNACGTLPFSDTIDITNNPNIITINYAFTNATAGFSVFRIYKNGVNTIVPLTASGNGSITAIPGDIMQVSLTHFGDSKHIVVNDSVSGDLYNVTNGNTSNSFTWTAIIAHDYTITATIS